MIPPVFNILSSDSDVIAKVPATRIRGQGFAGASPVAPYITWQVVGGLAHNYYAERPGGDSFRVQVDVWSKSAEECREIARRVRNALELHGVCVSIYGDSYETETQLYRYSTDWRFVTPR